MKEIMDFLKEERNQSEADSGGTGVFCGSSGEGGAEWKDSYTSFLLLWQKSVGGSPGSTFVWKESIAFR